MKKLILLFILILCGNAWGQIEFDGHTYDDSIHINSFPYTASTDNILYILTQDHSGVEMQSTGAIYFNDCDSCALVSEGSNKYTITFDTNGTGDQFGIRVTQSDWFKVRRIRLVAGWDYEDTLTQNHIMLDISNSWDCWVDSSYFFATGYSDVADWGNGLNAVRFIDSESGRDGAINNNITACSVETKGYGYPDRSKYPQVGIFHRSRYSDSLLTDGSPTDYTCRVAHNYIKSNWVGVFAYGQDGYSGVMVIDSNEFDVAFVNTSQEWFGTSFHGDGGAWGIAYMQKIFIRGNTTRSVNDVDATPKIYGGAGGFISHVIPENIPVNSPRSEVAYNDVRVLFQRDTTGAYLDHGTGMFVKYQVWNMNFHHNNIVAGVDSLGPGEVMGGWFSHIYDCSLSYNTFEVWSSVDNQEAYAIRLRAIDSLAPMNVFLNNTYKSNDWFIHWYPDNTGGGGRQDYGIRNQRIEGGSFVRNDTLSDMSGNGNAFGVSGWTMFDDTLVNISATGTAKDTVFLAPATSFTAGTELDWFRDLAINVVDNGGGGLNGAVTLVNAYGQTIYSSAVGTDGLDSSFVHYYRLIGGGATDSTAFNPIIGTASYAGEADVVDTFNVGANDSTITFTFTGVEGEATTNSKKIQGVYMRKGKL